MNARAQATATVEMPADSFPAILEMLGEVSAITIDGVSPPKSDHPKCRHFVPFGQPNDSIKRLLIYIDHLQKGHDDYVRVSSKGMFHDVVEQVFAGDADGKQAARLQVESKLEDMSKGRRDRRRRINLATMLLRLEVIRQFPQAADATLDDLVVDEDWTIGFIDHSNLAKEILERLRAFMGGDDELQEPLRHRTDPSLRDRLSRLKKFDAEIAIGIGADGKPEIIHEQLDGVPPEVAQRMRIEALRQVEDMIKDLGPDGFAFALDPFKMGSRGRDHRR